MKTVERAVSVFKAMAKEIGEIPEIREFNHLLDSVFGWKGENNEKQSMLYVQ